MEFNENLGMQQSVWQAKPLTVCEILTVTNKISNTSRFVETLFVCSTHIQCEIKLTFAIFSASAPVWSNKERSVAETATWLPFILEFILITANLVLYGEAVFICEINPLTNAVVVTVNNQMNYMYIHLHIPLRASVDMRFEVYVAPDLQRCFKWPNWLSTPHTSQI